MTESTARQRVSRLFQRLFRNEALLEVFVAEIARALDDVLEVPGELSIKFSIENVAIPLACGLSGTCDKTTLVCRGEYRTRSVRDWTGRGLCLKLHVAYKREVYVPRDEVTDERGPWIVLNGKLFPVETPAKKVVEELLADEEFLIASIVT